MNFSQKNERVILTAAISTHMSSIYSLAHQTSWIVDSNHPSLLVKHSVHHYTLSAYKKEAINTKAYNK